MERWPLDVDALEKGDVIGPEKIEKISGKSRNDPKAYRLEQLKLVQWIEKESASFGCPLIPKTEGDAIRILHDGEAIEYAERELMRHRRGQGKQVRRLSGSIDESKLSSKEQAHKDRLQCLWAARLTAMRKVRLPEPEDPKGIEGPQGDGPSSSRHGVARPG